MARAYRRWLDLLLIAGVLLRVLGALHHSLWYDEVTTLYVCQTEDLAATLDRDRHPPLSFLLFGWWVGLVGEQDSWVRLLPITAVLVALRAFAGAAFRWCPPPAAVVAFGFAAIGPVSVWYSTEVRMYAFVLAGSCLTLLAVARAESAGQAGWSARLLAFTGTALAFGSHYLGAIAGATVLVLAAFATWQRTLPRASALWLGGAALLGLLVWAPWVWTHLAVQRANEWGFANKSGLRDLLELPLRFVFHEFRLYPGWAQGVLGACGLLFSLALLSGAYVAFRGDRGAQRALLIIGCGLVAAGAAGLVAPLNFMPRYLLPMAPGVWLLAAAGLARVPYGRIAAVALLVACALASAYENTRNLREDFRSACTEVEAAWVPGDRIVSATGTLPGFNEAPLLHYLRDRPELLRSIAAPDAGLPAGTRLHVLYREADYAAPVLARLEQRAELLHSGPMRLRVQHRILRVR